MEKKTNLNFCQVHLKIFFSRLYLKKKIIYLLVLMIKKYLNFKKFRLRFYLKSINKKMKHISDNHNGL